MRNKIFGRKNVYLYFAGLIIFWALVVYARESGIAGRTSLGNGQGCSCHGTSSSNVSVIISGPPTLETNEVGVYAVTMVGGPGVNGGVDIASSAGDLNPASTGLRKDAATGDIVHSTPGTFTFGQLTYLVELTAPASAGSVTLAAAGNSVNGDGGNSGDQWNFAADKVVNVVAATGITGETELTPEKFTLEQNYPNPFNPITMIRYSISKPEIVNLSIFNSAGQQIKTLINAQQSAGNHSVTWDGKNDANESVSSGIYFYVLQSGQNVLSKKMILQR